MIGHPQAMTSRVGSHRRGFSLIELIVVLVITAILAAAAVPAMAGLAGTRAKAAARQVARDLAYARERGLATGTTVWVTFDTTSESYAMLQESVPSSGRSGATAITDPSTGRNFAQTFGTGEFSGIEITSVSIGGGTGKEVGFDWKGRPKDQAEAMLATTGTITMSGSNSITIEPETGWMKVLP
jgi:prepilin-type N-terminal cleavage/methylation domain-containing protein